MLTLSCRKETELLAFFLPQYHPIPENDKWWGKGFTEWHKVAQGVPLFEGHQQPHLPSDLGFYDLRVPEVREQQATLAREAGLSGFVYYHYWFNGRRLLERPINEILQSGRPDFPFCLCWANEPWTRNWDGENKSVLMPQEHSPEDDLRHIKELLHAFRDDRYIKVDGCPLFLVYRPSLFPDPAQTAALWRREVQKAGFPDLYLVAVRAFPPEFGDPQAYGFDASAGFSPNGSDCGPPLKSVDPLDIGYKIHNVWDYDTLARNSVTESMPGYPYFPGICPSWDNSVRRKERASIFRGAHPGKYGQWLFELLRREQHRKQEKSYIFINAWNEWAEGNHLEPCQHWGTGYIDATRDALKKLSLYQANFPWHAGQEVVVDPASKTLGSVDGASCSETEISFDGWVLSSATMNPLDAIIIAQVVGENTYRLIGQADVHLLLRKDVCEHLGLEENVACGYRGRIPLNELESPGRIALLGAMSGGRELVLIALLPEFPR